MAKFKRLDKEPIPEVDGGYSVAIGIFNKKVESGYIKVHLFNNDKDKLESLVSCLLFNLNDYLDYL